MIRDIALINQSTVLDDTSARRIGDALTEQSQRDFMPYWGVGARVTFFDRAAVVPPGFWALFLLDDADTPGVLGYHELPFDTVTGKVFCKTAIKYGSQPEVTASHELLEMLGDPYVNTLASTGSGNNMVFWAFENADACEGDAFAYKASNGVPVSDFVFPNYFDPTAKTGPFDFQGKIGRPFQVLAGGYLARYVPGEGWSQVLGDFVTGHNVVAHHASGADHVGNRFHRRVSGTAAAPSLI